MRFQEIMTDLELSFHEDVRSFHNNQIDMTLIAKADGEVVGKIDYSVYQGTPSIQMVTVKPDMKKRGIATALVHQLQSKFPHTEIDLGSLTDDGAKFFQTLKTEKIENKRYTILKKQLDAVNDKLAHYDTLAAAFDASEKTETQRQEFLKVVSDWNDLHDEQYRLENDLKDLKPYRTIFVTENKT